MIVADRKKVSEIRDMVKQHRRVLLVGCGTCVTVCLAGGEREVPDPYERDAAAFEHVLDLCEGAARGLLAELRGR